MDPGFGSRFGWLKEATGDVSDRPYPSRITQPNAASKPRRTPTGRAAPPDTHSRRELVSKSSRDGWFSRATYIVGTPSKMVTRSRSLVRRASPGSNRGSSVREEPLVTEALSPHV